MKNIESAYVYDKFSELFLEEQYSAQKLKEMEDSNDHHIVQFRSNLYSKKVYDEKYRIVFVNTEKPYFRSYGKGVACKFGFNSYNETAIHKAVKCGIAAAERLKIIINGKEYIIKKKSSETEEVKQLMGWLFETDCKYEIENIDPELEKILNGQIIYFEVHNKSSVSERKIIAYAINGFNIFEFDVMDDRLYKIDQNCIEDEKECVGLVKAYYENTDIHYIVGKFYPAIEFELEWNGGYAYVEDPYTRKKIQVTVYKDLYYKEKNKKDKYNINFKLDGGEKSNRYYLLGEPMEDFITAKKYAQYVLYQHVTGIAKIDFK